MSNPWQGQHTGAITIVSYRSLTVALCGIQFVLLQVLRHGQYFMVYPSGFLGRPRGM